MSSKNLIQSGILELYALGLCSEEESLRVEEALRNDEQVRKEYNEICDALDHLAVEQSTEVPASVKASLLDKLNEIQDEMSPKNPLTSETKTEKSTEAAIPSMPEPKVVEMHSRKWQWIAAASLVLFMASAGLNYRYYHRMVSAEEEAAVLRNNNMLLSDENGIIKSSYEIMQQEYAFLSDKNLKAANLLGTEAYPDLEAMVFWDKQKGDVYLVTNELPALGEDEQYQLWALDNGQPKDAGMIPMDFQDGGAYKLKNVASSQAFAITIEKKGGSPSPTLEKMVVFGSL